MNVAVGCKGVAVSVASAIVGREAVSVGGGSVALGAKGWVATLVGNAVGAISSLAQAESNSLTVMAPRLIATVFKKSLRDIDFII